MSAQMSRPRSCSADSTVSTALSHQEETKNLKFSPPPSREGLKELESHYELAKTVPTLGVLDRFERSRRSVAEVAHRALGSLASPRQVISMQSGETAPARSERAVGTGIQSEFNRAVFVATRLVSLCQRPCPLIFAASSLAATAGAFAGINASAAADSLLTGPNLILCGLATLNGLAIGAGVEMERDNARLQYEDSLA
jgi:hypothetical protein